MDAENPSNSKTGLYNEERNLRRIQEKERRNQEAHQEKEPFLANVPLFGEPYKINKADELSSRIQNMLGNYEEMKELITTKSHQSLIGIRHVMSLIPQRKPDRRLFPEKASSMLPSSFQNSSRHPKHLGPVTSGAPSAGCSAHFQKVHSRTEPASNLQMQSRDLSSNQRQAPEQSYKTQEIQSRRCQKKNEKCLEDEVTKELQSLSELSPLLSTLSSPIAPLSPLHSSQRDNSRSHSSSNHKSHGPKSSPSQDLVAGMCDDKSQDSLSAPGPVSSQPLSQTFPSSLPSKISAGQQKPTAYVRPMDGQDQVLDESPDLKPLPEEYHEESYEKIADIKMDSKASLPTLKIPTESVESFSNEVHCVEEILREMTHSWPPPLTAIHTPSTPEPSKFPFPAKESQHSGSVIQSQKHYDAPSNTLSVSHQGISTLQEDLLLSDSEDGEDDQVSDKPSSSSTPPSAPQSQPESLALARSSSPESETTSDSDSSSDSESSSSDSEANDPPSRASLPEPCLQTSSRWQLNNWLIKVQQPVSPAETFPEDDRSRCSLQESKEQSKACSSSSSSSDSSKSECPQPAERHSKASGKTPRSAPEVHLPTKRRYQKSPVYSGRQTVGTKQPKKSSKALVLEEQKGGLKVESEPLTPYEAKDQSSKDKPKVKTKGTPKLPADRKEPRPTAAETSEKKKHKTSHHATVKSFSNRGAVKDNVFSSTLEQLPVSPRAQSSQVPAASRTSGTKPTAVAREDLQRDKCLLPIRDKKVLSPLRDCPVSQSLVVKIDLDLLSRIPQPGRKESCPKRLEIKESHNVKKLDADRKSTEMPSKFPKKRKQGDASRDDQKKIKLERETKSSSLPSHKDSSKNKASKIPVEMQRKELPLPPASPMQPAQKLVKTIQKRPQSESHASSQPPGVSNSAARSKESHKDSSSSKQRKMEGKPSEISNSSKGPSGDSNPFPVPSLPNGTSKPTKLQIKPHKEHSVEFHLNEAKRLKHKADAMTDKVGKAFKYLDAALSFIECGSVMESDAVSQKAAYTMFAETIDLIKFIMTLKSFMDTSTSTNEKIFAILCMRCQAILYMAMFRYKKETAIKYSRTLNEHFKSSSRITQAPSPCVSRSTGTPSPLSPMPSPASSVSSQTGSSASSCSGGSMGSSISVPSYIPSITSSFINITSCILYAYDIWEQADVLARKYKKFFSELSAAVCTLSLNSGMMELVPYTRQGLQWLKLEPNTP